MSKMSKVGDEFIKELNEIKNLRRKDIDKDLAREISNERLTEGLIKMAEWDAMKIKLIKEPRDLFKDKKKTI